MKFRYNAAAAVAGLIVAIGAVPLATSRVYLLPILLVPLAIAAGAWRAGTDASTRGLRVRALLGSRFVPWSRVERSRFRRRRSTRTWSMGQPCP